MAAEPGGNAAAGEGTAEKPKKKTRRGTRGGRKRKKKPATLEGEATTPGDDATEPIATAEEAG